MGSLYVEANQPSLSSRRTQLSLAFSTKMVYYSTNPAYDCVSYAQHEYLYALHQRFTPSFGVGTLHHEPADSSVYWYLPQHITLYTTMIYEDTHYIYVTQQV